jgi:glucoamylase
MFGCSGRKGFAFLFLILGASLNEKAWAIGSARCIFVLRGRLQTEEKIVEGFLSKPKSFERFLKHEKRLALELLIKNVMANGAVAAASSRSEPDYGFHWRRDGALIYQVLWREAQSEALIRKYIEADIEMLAQASPGKAKFNLDLTPYSGVWAEPQNDGPALDVLLLSDYANFLLNRSSKGDVAFVFNHLYSTSPRSHQLISSQAEYLMNVYHHAHDVEPWEEGWGRHFYNAKVQLQSLLKAAELAEKLWDSVAAEQYRSAAYEIRRFLEKEHWDDERRIYRSTVMHPEHMYRPGHYDWRKNKSELDIGVLLSFLHTDSSVNDPRLMSTFFELRKAAREEYFLNQKEKRFKYALAMGRYPGDMWDGVNRSGGNPWFLSTFAASEMLFKLAHEYKESKTIVVDELSRDFFIELVGAFAPEKVSLFKQRYFEFAPHEILSTDELFPSVLDSLKMAGDEYLMLGLSHTSPDGRIDEQFNAFHGYMQGAQNLSWSYAALITAIRAREQLESRSSF